MKVQDLFEDQSLGTLSVSPSGDGFVVNASAKSGPIVKLFDNRPQGLVFFGVDQETVQAAADDAVARVEKEVKAQAKHKADAPKRRAEASKFAADERKRDMAEYDKLYGKGTWNRVKYKQEGGDDGYSYVVHVDSRSKWNGLTKREAMHYKKTEVEAIAKKEKLGKYAEAK